MSELRKLTGTPWHTDKWTRAEGDSRRHSHNCIYFSGKDKYCSYTIGKCTGSAHCDYYKEKSKSKN